MNEAEEGRMDKITTEMAEYICDSICQYPITCQDEQSLEEICWKCRMGKFICDIMNEHDRKIIAAGKDRL